MAEITAHADWLITGLEKVILPAQEIHLDRSRKHCINKILKQTKSYYAVCGDKEHSPIEF